MGVRKNVISESHGTRKKHPSVGCHQSTISTKIQPRNYTFDKTGEQIVFSDWIILFHKGRQRFTHAIGTHVRRIRHHHMILLYQRLRLPQQRLHGLYQRPHIGLLRHVQQVSAAHQVIQTVAQEGQVVQSQLGLQNAAVFLGVGETVKQLLRRGDAGLRRQRIVAGKGLPQGMLISRPGGRVLNGEYIRLNMAAEPAAVILPRFHHDGEVRQLRGAVVYVQTPQVFGDDAGYRLAGGNAVGLINLYKRVEQDTEDVPAALTGIDAEDILRLDGGVAFANFRQLRLDSGFLLGLFQIILPLTLQFIVRVSFHPQAAEAVLHHIAHNPVRREELRRGRNLFLADLDVLFEVSKHFILRLAVIVLIQPADDLHLVCPVRLRDQRDHLLKHTAAAQQEIGEEQFGIVLQLLEQTGQDAVQRVALHDQQVFIQFFRLVGVLHLVDLAHVKAFEFQMNRLVQNLRLKSAIVIGEHANMGGQIAIDLHEAQSGKAVKPGIGRLFHDLLIALLADSLNQGGALTLLRLRQQVTIHGIRAGIARVLFRYSIYLCALPDAVDQLDTRPDGVLFDGVLIHAYLLSLA